MLLHWMQALPSCWLNLGQCCNHFYRLLVQMRCRYQMKGKLLSLGAGTIVRLMMDQLLWAPVFLSTIVACQFTLEVSQTGLHLTVDSMQ